MVLERKTPQTEDQMLQTAVDGMDSEGGLGNDTEVKRDKEKAAQAAHDAKVDAWNKGYGALSD
ncbi:hypothetical protein A6J80_17255 [Paracoccus yeei]|uniref:Uncharacterized protein n=1 Tax=Paracoccus yeei TaxID=147645 RepID=A0A1V0GVF9_9RHOB|nr:hypothetical protein [Paracoccus yeei]ARC37863.1 hypothetical protein A6J80_17255 [Paracoccus yeei]